MKTKKSLLSSLSSFFLIPVVVISILIDKPDYIFFNFLHRNTVPVAQAMGQFLSYPIRLVGKISTNIRNNKIVAKENKIIKEKLVDFDRLRAENEILKKENNLLLQKLNMPANRSHKTVFARIVHNNSFFGTQNFIAKIEDDNVLNGNIVLSNNGFLLGNISQTVGNFAKILSVTDNKSNIPVRFAGTNVFGFLQGDGFSKPKIKFLSDGSFIPEKGMILITSGVNGNIPDNIPVGKVTSVKNDHTDVELGAELKNQESVVILLFDKKNSYD